MGGKYNVKETKEFLGFILGFGGAVGLAMEDEKVGLVDAVHLVRPLMQAGPAFTGIGMTPKELAEMDEAYKEELTDYAQAEFDIPQEAVEEVVDEALATAIQVHSLVRKIMALTKKEESVG